MGMLDALRGKGSGGFDPIYVVVVDQPTPPSPEVTMGIVDAFVASGDLAEPTNKTRILRICYPPPWGAVNDPPFVHAVYAAVRKSCPEMGSLLLSTPSGFDRDESIHVATIDGLSATGERFRCVEILPR